MGLGPRSDAAEPQFGASDSDDALAKGFGDGLNAGRNAELRLGAVDVEAHRPGANPEELADVGVGLADRHMTQALGFADR